MPTLVSVILPTYNRAELLGEAIDSVLAQSHSELELLVIDDGSTDGTRDLVAERYGHDERIRYHRQENAGVAAARNWGMRLSRGELVAFIDSDDAWEPWKLDLQIRCLEAAPEAGMLWTDMQAIGPDGEHIAPAYLTHYYRAYRYFTREMLFPRAVPLSEASGDLPVEAANRKLYVGDIFSEMIMGNLVHTPTVILRRERLERTGWFNETFQQGGEDFDYYLRTCREGPVAYADVSSIRYRVGLSDNLSNPANNIHLARHYLAAIEPVLKRDRTRITLPPEMIATARAYGHLWLGRNLLVTGSQASARAHLRQTLRLRLWQPEALLLLAVASVPPSAGVPLARALRAIKRWLSDRRER